MNPEFAVNHSSLILRLHGAASAGVMAPGVVLDMPLQLIVGVEMAAGNLFFDNEIADRIGDFAPEFDPGDNRIEIIGGVAITFAEIMEIDLRPVKGVAAS